MTEPRKPKKRGRATEITTQAAADILGVDQDTVRAQAARLQGRKVLGRWRWPLAVVQAAAAGEPAHATE